MVTRVTSQTQQQNALNNIFRITEELFKVQNEISSSRRINKPSDDPSGLRSTLALRTDIGQINQFGRNINNNQIFLQNSDSALNSIVSSLLRARELSIVELSGLSTAQTRGFAAAELDTIISSVFQSANTKVKNTFLFSGTKTRTIPFELSASGAVYKGDTNNFTIRIATDVSVKITVPGSDVLTADLNPDLNTSTSVSQLNGGSGIQAGSFTITDRAGNSAAIAITSSMTISDVLSAINGASVNVTASVNSASNGITLTDTSSVITQSLTVSEVSGGTTASSLGILGKKDGNIEGIDLNPTLSRNTLLSELNGGSGMTLSDISVINGSASGTVSLSSASTIGDVIDLINGSGLNVTADINSGGNVLNVISNDSSTVAMVNDIGTGTTAEDFGIGGGRNVINTFIKLQKALEQDDTAAILASLINLESGLESINESRAVLGAVLRRIESTEAIHQQDVVDRRSQMGELEGTDLIEAASRFVALETALQAALSSTARIIQPSLLDFLR